MSSLRRRILKASHQLPLRAILTIPFVIQVVATTGLVGYLSFKNGQKAVNNLANQLMEQVSDRIDRELHGYLVLPHQINQLNLDAIERGLLDLKDIDSAGRYFWKQAQIFPNFSFIGYVLADQTGAGAGRWLEGYDLVITSHPGGGLKDYTYDANAQGQPGKLVYETDYDGVNDEWYEETAQARKPIWSRIYLAEGFDNYITASANAPIYDKNGKLLGVLTIDLLLSNISQFLQEIDLSPTGKIFIMERDGMLIANSGNFPTYQTKDQQTLDRISGFESSSEMIQSTVKHLQTQFGDFKNIYTRQQLMFSANGERLFVQLVPWQDEYGLDWLVAIVVPENDFMAEINQNKLTTLLLCLLALGISVAIGIVTARWVANPILRLNLAAKEIAQGNFDHTVPISRADELGQLSIAFNTMAAQLQTSFIALEKTNQELEERVAQRTASLAQAEAELRGLLEAMTELIFVVDREGRYLKVIANQPELLYIPKDTLIGRSVAEVLPPKTAAFFMSAIATVLDNQQATSIEYCLNIAGKEVWFAANLSPIGDDSVVCVARDISYRKENEEKLRQKNEELIQALEKLKTAQSDLIQSEKLAALGQLVAGIAHEINTPLGAIRASISNAIDSLNRCLRQFPQLLGQLSSTQLADFFTLLEMTHQPQELLSFREERKLKRTLQEILTSQGIDNPEALANNLSKMGISPDLIQPTDREDKADKQISQALIRLLQSSHNTLILDAVYHLFAVQNNSQNILLATDRAGKIVFALKNYIRQDSAGKKVIASIPQGIDTVLTIYYNQLKRGVEVIKTYASVPPILCHPEELIQVWSNLISNAIQAMDYRGQLQISVLQENKGIVVKISDSGVGIPPEIQPKIFEPFFTTKPMGEGSGLGLDIVQKIVNKHQGKIELETQPGHTTFSVWLPL